MPEFQSNGVTINYIVEGEGRPIVLVHGFASSLQGNWRATGTVDALTAAGRKVIALDCRGHGRSAKPHDPAAYGGAQMADDVIALMDHVGIDKADLMGYSMGAGISASLLTRHPERFTSVILGGMGDGLLSGGRAADGRNAIADALEAPDGTHIDDPTALGFRVFAKRSGNDLLALAAIQRSARGGADPAKLASTTLPVMVIVGEGDTLVGSADRLAKTIPNAHYVKVPGDHITALNDPAYNREVVKFLGEVAPV